MASGRVTSAAAADTTTGRLRPTSHDGWGAVLAWYSLIHFAASELPEAIASLVRPLRARGWLVLALPTGTQVRSDTAWFGHGIDLDFVLHDSAEISAIVEDAGLPPVRPRSQAVNEWRGLRR